MTLDELLIIARRQHYVAMSTSGETGPQSSTMRCAVGDKFELVFGTLVTSRKFANMQRDPRVAVLLWNSLFSMQIEGSFDLPDGQELDRLKAVFSRAFPADFRDREARPAHRFFRVTPRWLRLCDFADEPARVTSVDFTTGVIRESAWPPLEKGV